MELLGYERSSLTVLFELARPIGQLYLPQVVHELVSRYQFALFPRDYSQMTSESIRFEHGWLNEIAFDLTVYRDGAVFRSNSNTDILDVIMSDVSSWMSQKFSVSPFKNQPVDRMYESAIIFHSQKDVLYCMDCLSAIKENVASLLKKTSGQELNFESFGFSIAPNVTQIPGIRPAPFKVERRIGAEFSQKIYYSIAPLKTDDHIQIINLLERSSSR